MEQQENIDPHLPPSPLKTKRKRTSSSLFLHPFFSPSPKSVQHATSSSCTRTAFVPRPIQPLFQDARAKIPLGALLSSFTTHPSAKVVMPLDTLPFALCLAQKSAKLAVASEAGCVTVRSSVRPAAGSVGRFQPHLNAVFDLCFSSDESKVVSASADQTIAVSDVASGSTSKLPKSHSASVKALATRQNEIVSAGRDGIICIWDMRLSDPVKRIAAYPAKKKGPQTTPTSLAFMPRSPITFLSACSSSGVVSLWDMRMSRSVIEESQDGTRTASGRSYGITSIVAHDGLVWALGMDSKIYRYSGSDLKQKSTVPPLSHPDLNVSSFYIKLSISPDGRVLCAGSSAPGHPVLFDTLSGQSASLAGHDRDRDVNAVAMGDNYVWTASDDETVRRWAPRYDWGPEWER